LRVFVSEYVCGGGWPKAEISGSLALEGRAMLTAVVDDLSRISDVEVATTWDARLGALPFRSARTTCVKSRAHEWQLFERLAAECDATLVIAPESGGTLFARCQAVETVGGRLLGPRSRAVALCADKLRLADHLHGAGVRTIPTVLRDVNAQPPGQGSAGELPFPLVVKPRDGAGSQQTRLIADAGALEQFRRECGTASIRSEFILQPYIAGQPYSVALLISRSGREIEVLPPAKQLLSADGQFTYRGGRLPCGAGGRNVLVSAALSACQSVPDLRGYVGVDLIVPEQEPRAPIVVEINPRLTTSYLGYRALAAENIAEWLLLPARFRRPVQWRSGSVEFDAAGRME
jgi:predicted ATP-grasp superfamily ATP-dependent carboligase